MQKMPLTLAPLANPWRRRLLLAAPASLALAACASLPGGLTAPEVALADVRLGNSSLLEQSLILQLRVHNPNPIDIPVSGLSFALEINGAQFARGSSNRAVTLTRLSDTLVEIEAITGLLALIAQLRALSNAPESLAYRLHGDLFPTRGSLRLPFERQGKIDLSPLTGSLAATPPDVQRPRSPSPTQAR